MVALVAISLWVSGFSSLGVGWIGIYTPLIVITYLGIVKMIHGYEKRQQVNADVEMVPRYADVSLKRAYIIYGIAAMFIIAAGVWLAFIGDEIAAVTGLGRSFVGSLFLGFITTLPEVVVGISALRIGAIDIVVGDTIGSNMFNMLVVAIDDLFYTAGPILAHVSQIHVRTGLVVILMTGVLTAGLMSPPRRKTPLGASWYTFIFIGLFVVGAYLNFRLA